MTKTDAAHDPLVNRLPAGQSRNLSRLASHLSRHAPQIEAGGGLRFSLACMTDLHPLPEECTHQLPTINPPLAYAPLAGIEALPGEDWQEYCSRCFGIEIGPPDPLCIWIQSSLWRKTDPSAASAALRITHALHKGLPRNFVEIAMGRSSAGTALAEGRLELDVQELRNELIARGIARQEEIAGVPESGIRWLEWMIGSMPRSYRNLIGVIGNGAGRLVDARRYQILADQLVTVNWLGRRQCARWWSDPHSDPVPDDAIFICAQDELLFWFILRDYRFSQLCREDSPVFLFDSRNGRVRKVAPGIRAWVEELVRSATLYLETGLPPARRSHDGC